MDLAIPVVNADWSELEKIAVSISELQSAFRRVRPIRMSRRMSKEVGSPIYVKNRAQRLASGEPPLLSTYEPELPEGQIGVMKKGVPKWIRPKGMTPEGHKALNLSAFGHELAEKATKPRRVSQHGKFLDYSHLSPDVLLREHNILTTLTGPGADEAKGALIQLRSDLGESFVLARELKKRGLKDFEFGRSPRLSRHQIKRLINPQDRPWRW